MRATRRQQSREQLTRLFFFIIFCLFSIISSFLSPFTRYYRVLSHSRSRTVKRRKITKKFCFVRFFVLFCCCFAGLNYIWLQKLLLTFDVRLSVCVLASNFCCFTHKHTKKLFQFPRKTYTQPSKTVHRSLRAPFSNTTTQTHEPFPSHLQ